MGFCKDCKHWARQEYSVWEDDGEYNAWGEGGKGTRTVSSRHGICDRVIYGSNFDDANLMMLDAVDGPHLVECSEIPTYTLSTEDFGCILFEVKA